MLAPLPLPPHHCLAPSPYWPARYPPAPVPGVLSVHSAFTGAIHGRGGAQTDGVVNSVEAHAPRFGDSKAAATDGAKDEQRPPCCWAFPVRKSRDVGEPGTVRLADVCSAIQAESLREGHHLTRRRLTW